jgi:hypothetical protein
MQQVMAANSFIVNVRVTTLCGSLVGEYRCLGLHSASLLKAEHSDSQSEVVCVKPDHIINSSAKTDCYHMSYVSCQLCH